MDNKKVERSPLSQQTLGVVRLLPMNEVATRVLLVDEDYAEYMLVAHLLEQIKSSTYHLSWCSSHDRALEDMLNSELDVILLDCQQAPERARQLLNLVQRQNCDTPIILMNDEHNLELDRQAIADGASDYVVKGQLDVHALERSLRYASGRRDTQRKISSQAHYDGLTGIPNRALFHDRLQQAIERAKRNDQPLALLHIDLVGFKRINESFGHDAGDEIVIAAAQRLATCMRRTDSIARIGGDEFTVILEEFTNPNDVVIVAGKIIDFLARPFDVGNNQVALSASIGIAVYPEAGETVNDLLSHADMATRSARTQRGSHYRFYSEKMNVDAINQLHLEADLRRALRRNELELFYQPRVNLESGDIIGMEGLIRWRHPERGLLSPSEFIPLAEEVGLIVPMGYWTIQQACQDMLALKKRGFPPLEMAVNVSFKQLQDSKFVETVSRLVKNSGIDPRLLELELTETAVMENFEETYSSMIALNKLGISFSLDDFGTGYSSLTHIQRLPVSIVKIDQGFMRNVMSSTEDATIVKAIINLAHNLNLKVIAEGVETLEQIQFLWQHHCDQVQGYYFSPAVRLEHLIQMLSQRATAAL
jgi:diguanylate cyclase (GGDEF)-like protein